MDAGLFLRRQRQGPLQTNTTEGNDPRAWRNLGANSSTRLRGAKKNGGGSRLELRRLLTGPRPSHKMDVSSPHPRVRLEGCREEILGQHAGRRRGKSGMREAGRISQAKGP